MTEQEQRLIDLYDFMKAALELCTVEVMAAHHTQGDAEILAIASAMADDWGQFWQTFREKWGIPEHPFAREIMEMSSQR
jgi:hypothetical protein